MANDVLSKIGEGVKEIPIIGGVFGESRAEKAANEAAARKNQLMGEAAQNYAAYRPIQMQQRMNAVNNIAGMFAPVNKALGQMYGKDAQFDMGNLTNSPMVSGQYMEPRLGEKDKYGWTVGQNQGAASDYEAWKHSGGWEPGGTEEFHVSKDPVGSKPQSALEYAYAHGKFPDGTPYQPSPVNGGMTQGSKDMAARMGFNVTPDGKIVPATAQREPIQSAPRRI